MADKYFKRQEAEELLPMIGGCLEQAREKKQEIDGLEGDLSRASARIMVLGGSIPTYTELAKKKAERDQLMSQMMETIEKIQQTGCLVKDLDRGLVDFPTLMEGEEVYLCWKLGEERIGYWHGIHEGFAGRKPLDESRPHGDPPGPPRVQ